MGSRPGRPPAVPRPPPAPPASTGSATAGSATQGSARAGCPTPRHCPPHRLHATRATSRLGRLHAARTVRHHQGVRREHPHRPRPRKISRQHHLKGLTSLRHCWGLGAEARQTPLVRVCAKGKILVRRADDAQRLQQEARQRIAPDPAALGARGARPDRWPTASETPGWGSTPRHSTLRKGSEVALDLPVSAGSHDGVLPPALHAGQGLLVRVITLGDALVQVRVLGLDDLIGRRSSKGEVTRAAELLAGHGLHRDPLVASPLEPWPTVRRSYRGALRKCRPLALAGSPGK